MPLFLRGRLEKTQIFVVRVHAIQPNHGSDLSKKFPKITLSKMNCKLQQARLELYFYHYPCPFLSDLLLFQKQRKDSPSPKMSLILESLYFDLALNIVSSPITVTRTRARECVHRSSLCLFLSLSGVEQRK